ncbi:hypothetical protein OH77DRAFT_355447 [Trametes cingulata]|nr:hypothetical protein OH77DRAFT_355447 [Trametes cingulata]
MGAPSSSTARRRKRKDLEMLEHTCDLATFGIDHKKVFDEAYREAGKLQKGQFSMQFDPFAAGLLDAVRTSLLSGRRESERGIRAELYKLNVYRKNAFFKAPKDTPDSESMLGSLVIVLPTPHKGGSLLLRHEDKEWTFDSAKVFSNLRSKVTSHNAQVAFCGHSSPLLTLSDHHLRPPLRRAAVWLLPPEWAVDAPAFAPRPAARYHVRPVRALKSRGHRALGHRGIQIQPSDARLCCIRRWRSHDEASVH